MDTLTIQSIKDAAKQAFGSRSTITTFSKLIQLIKQKCPQLKEEVIKKALADIEGWHITARSQHGEIEITPSFFS